ncbi:hypothetical protein ACFL27_06700 [candidate division CSSED10-310 bacterium]|uniref:Uncharacterized protein n=1 Tax=candidate division CSSED10-310 bacterium TaxID=2855610 RepID=A0ABV6YUJ9_UNCC1
MNKLFNLFTSLSVVLLCLFGCKDIEMIKKFRSGNPVSSTTHCTIPFLLDGHEILINASINESHKEYCFLPDTVALTMINRPTVKELNLVMSTEMPTMDNAQDAK